ILVDELGRKIDRQMVDLVTTLRMIGINTISSCEGHIGRITGGPYIMFKAREASPLEPQLRRLDPATASYRQLRRKVVRLNLRERQKLTPYLETFYANRLVRYD